MVSYNEEIQFIYSNLLSDFEGQRKVVSSLCGQKLGVVVRLREEVVDQRAERHPVRPTR